METLARIPVWFAGTALAVIAAAFVYILAAEPRRFEFAGLTFGFPDRTDRTLAGSVIAFRRDTREAGAPCPDGWTVFEPAIGRMVLGARAPLNDGGDGPRALRPAQPEDPAGGVGGAETVTLKLAEMPAHSHSSGGTNGAVLRYRDGDRSFDFSDEGGQSFSWARLASSGGGAAHENMPPFVALYLCTPDGG
ncbi:MAG: hypothetical protein AAFV86_19425 [Pseudomonadota bacterium]